MLRKKVVNLKIKKAGPKDDLPEGGFLGYASVFGNVDSYGDRVVKGAFEETLSDWASKADSGLVIPLLYGHDMSDPNNNVGHIVKAEEDDHGLLVQGQMDLEGGNGPQVYRLVKGGRLNQMSFAYDILDYQLVKANPDDPDDDDQVLELLKLRLYEVSLVPVGANQETEVVGVKGLSAGQVAALREFDPSQIKALRDLVSNPALPALLGKAPAPMTPPVLPGAPAVTPDKLLVDLLGF